MPRPASVFEVVLGFRPRAPHGARVRAAVAGRLVVVTGASRGIGAECARQFARAGAEVVLLARDQVALEGVADGIRSAGGTAHPLAVDLRDQQATTDAAATILARHGVPSVVIANAGHSMHRTLAEYADRPHDAVRVTLTNYLGHVALLSALMPRMPRTGVVVGVTSISAVVPAPGWSLYGASKAALDAWLLAVAQEDGPRVRVVRLPLVRTRMAEPLAAYRRDPAMRPVDAAASIARAVTGPRRVVQPWWMPAVQVLLALSPAALDRVLAANERRIRKHGR